MPHPKDGYFNAAGETIPGTTQIIDRFKNPQALIHWAWKRGKDGLPRYAGRELTIGSVVHKMAELDIQGQSDDDIEFYLTATLHETDDIERARNAFKAFRQWRSRFHIDAHTQEQSMVSEKYQYGGTIDVVAFMRGGLGLVDLKTSKDGDVYPDHIWQLAAYGMLWEENHPNEVLSAGYHLITLPKDGSKPRHREFSRADLDPFREQFKLFRKVWDLDLHCTSAKVLKGIPVAPSIAPEKPAKTVRKPQARVEAPTQRPMSMAEIMRAYGHTKVMA